MNVTELSRAELIDFIYKNNREEFIRLSEVFDLAKESKKQLRERVNHILAFMGYQEDKATVEKIFPIPDRQDFFKYIILTKEGVAKDYKGEEMYFDEFELKRAESICESINKVKRLETKL